MIPYSVLCCQHLLRNTTWMSLVPQALDKALWRLHRWMRLGSCSPSWSWASGGRYRIKVQFVKNHHTLKLFYILIIRAGVLQPKRTAALSSWGLEQVLCKMGVLVPISEGVVRINQAKLFTEPTTVPGIVANTNKWWSDGGGQKRGRKRGRWWRREGKWGHGSSAAPGRDSLRI